MTFVPCRVSGSTPGCLGTLLWDILTQGHRLQSSHHPRSLLLPWLEEVSPLHLAAWGQQGPLVPHWPERPMTLPTHKGARK